MSRSQAALGDAMAMSSKTRISFVALLLFLVIAVVLLMTYRREIEETAIVGSPDTKAEIAMDHEGSEGEAEGVEMMAPSESLGPAKRIAHVPDSRRPKQLASDNDWIPNQITAENIASFTDEALSRALNGDYEAADRFTEIQMSCGSIPKTKDELEARIKQMNEAAASRKSMGFPILSDDSIVGAAPGEAFFSSPQRNRDYQTQWFHGCQSAMAIFSKDLRRRLDELAAAGDVMARYLYAIWKMPVQFEVGAFDEVAEWQLKALEYSYANLTEGHSAGLLAFGRSYNLGLFTQTDVKLSSAFMLAALECGLWSSRWVQAATGGAGLNALLSKDPEKAANREKYLLIVQPYISYCQ